MKRLTKTLAIILATIMLMPFTMVNAQSSKIERALELLNSSETMMGINGTATYEDGMIEIEYTSTDSSFSEIYLTYENDIIEYIPGELNDYDDATIATGTFMYAINYFLFSALQLNGYTQDQITAYFRSQTSNPTFEINGFEFKTEGEEQTFESDDGYSKLTVTPMSVKIDVSKANLNASASDAPVKTETTVEDVINHLNADESFVKCEWEDGTIAYENEIIYEDGLITVGHTDYIYNYHNTYFDCEDDILTYEVTEIENYEDAEKVLQDSMWLTVLIQYALEANGHSEEEISKFFDSEENELDYERNGIEFKELGEEKLFEGDMGDITVSPLSVKIDFAKANIKSDAKEYAVLDGKDQNFDSSKGHKLSFRFDIDYDTFVKEGKVFVDTKEVPSVNYNLAKGSTIVTFTDDYTKTLSVGKHTILVSTSTGQATADFTVAEVKDTVSSPKTGDIGDISVICTILLMLSLAGISVSLIKYKKN